MVAIEFNKRVRDTIINEVVAVTNGGPIDAPALKIADIGFAMVGIAGTDVASKQAWLQLWCVTGSKMLNIIVDIFIVFFWGMTSI